MSSDVLLGFGTDVPSPPSTTSDDNDAVNTDSARVYFGPLQSPEKKFTSTILHTPLRRSSRLSPAVEIGLEIRGTEEENHPGSEDGSGSREATPVQDLFQDEPSFVLASKVLQAHDNPSPPPSPNPHQRASPTGFDFQVDISESPARDPGSPLPSYSPSPYPRSPRPVPGSEANRSQPDLITFDSFSTPSVSSMPRHLEPITRTASPSPASRNPTSTIDDLLSLSPQPHSSAPPDSPSHALGEVNTSSDEEAQVSAALKHKEASPRDPMVLPVPKPVAEIQRLDVEPQSPVRRSSRSRRSVTPSGPRLVSELAAAAHELPGTSGGPLILQSEATRTQHPLQSPAGLRVRRKSRSRDVTPNDSSAGKIAEDSTQPIKQAFVDDEPATGAEGEKPRVDRTHRELGSLSPTSASLLMQLLPNASGSAENSMTQSTPTQAPGSLNDLPSGATTQEFKSPLPPQDNPTTLPAFNILSPPVVTDIEPSSPSKLADPNRTPARRIPISQAMVEGTFSARKYTPSVLSKASKPSGAGVGLFGSPVFKRPVLNDPNRSPAKRVPISAAQFAPASSPDKGKAPMWTSSPMRASSQEPRRSNSVEPKPQLVKRARSKSAETQVPVVTIGRDGLFARPLPSGVKSNLGSTSGNHAQAEKTRTTLPFPIVASSSRLPSTIPEVEENDHMPKSPPEEPQLPSSSPVASPARGVSILRQPSAGAASRIPRIGAKPYARPKIAEHTPAKEQKPPMVARRATGVPGTTHFSVDTGSARPLRMLRTGSGHNSEASSSKLITPGSALDTGDHPAATSANVENPSVKVLKRKRDGEQSRASPPGAQPIVLVRRVVPGMFNQAPKVGSSPLASPPKKENTRRNPSPQKSQGPVKMRRVVDWKRPARENGNVHSAETRQQTQDPSSDAEGCTATERNATSQASASGVPVQSSAEHATRPRSPTEHTTRPSSPTPLTELDSQPSNTRRSTRSRRPVPEATSDVFGTVVAATVRPLNIRRKRPPLDSSTFSGMTAVALKALTSSNTAKNQHQVVAIKTEVVRKEGKRPDSPTTKVRTVLERQRELKAQEREERAARRAKRSSEGGDAELEDYLSTDETSTIILDGNGIPQRHRRGPGDEEDYETPPRPDRPFKRERLEDGVDVRDEKRVKWDRGLSTVVYLDGSPPKPKRPSKTDLIQRGCLTPVAKSIRLDTLGNVLNAEVPLTNLVRENVIVKKFVYDDDPAPETVDAVAPDPSPAPVKSTKTRSKKAKT